MPVYEVSEALTPWLLVQPATVNHGCRRVALGRRCGRGWSGFPHYTTERRVPIDPNTRPLWS